MSCQRQECKEIKVMDGEKCTEDAVVQGRCLRHFWKYRESEEE